jgi:hypothetical protein
MEDETISQYSAPGNQIIDELLKFALNFDQEHVDADSDIIDSDDAEENNSNSLPKRIES